MTKTLTWLSFLLGASIIGWMGSAFMAANLLAFIVVVAISCVYLFGFIELTRYQAASQSLGQLLSQSHQPVADLTSWLQQLPPSIRIPVKQKIVQEHAAVPTPALTSYLVGLLVMLGLIGTFIGMVDTLKGAVLALQQNTDLEAIRSGLAAPMQGLSMAFGTSVAGVSAAAVLGLISTLSRRDRLLCWRQLDAQRDSTFAVFSATTQRQQAYQAIQAQASAWPQLSDNLAQLGQSLGRMASDLSQSLQQQQQAFLSETAAGYQALSNSVAQTVNQSMVAAGEDFSRRLQPLLADTISQTQQQVVELHEQWHKNNAELLHSQLTSVQTLTTTLQQDWLAQNQTTATKQQEILDQQQAILSALETQSAQVLQQNVRVLEQQMTAWMELQVTSEAERLQTFQQVRQDEASALTQQLSEMARQLGEQQQQQLTRLEASQSAGEALVQLRREQEDAWFKHQQAAIESLVTSIREELSALKQAEIERGAEAVAGLGELQDRVSQQLGQLGQALQEPLTALMETAAESPKAAAEVLLQLRQEMTAALAKDNQLLQERQQTMQQLDQLAESLLAATTEQKAAIQAMATATGTALHDVSERFAVKIDQDITRLSENIDGMTLGAIDLAAVSEGFAAAVQDYQQSNQVLVEFVTRLESQFEVMTERSDEQMGYYVAQAREIIDHSLLSQQEMIEQLRRLSRDTSVVE